MYFGPKYQQDSSRLFQILDPTAGSLFGELAGTISQGFRLIVGEFNPVKM